jgi:hypothetical protein
MIGVEPRFENSVTSRVAMWSLQRPERAVEVNDIARKSLNFRMFLDEDPDRLRLLHNFLRSDFSTSMRVEKSPNDRTADARALRVRCWVGECLRQTGSENLHALARFVEPELAWCNPENGERTWTNKWRGYSKGSRAPREALVDKVAELKMAGRSCYETKRVFHHVLWDVLAVEEPKPALVGHWFSRLEAELPAIFLRVRWLPATSSDPAIPEIGMRQSHQLERCICLDSLALATLIFLQASNRRSEKLASLTGSATVQLLHLLFPTFLELGVAEPMLAFYRRWIINGREGLQALFSLDNDIASRVDLMMTLMRSMREKGVCMDTIKDCERELRAAFDGRYGLPIRVLLLRPHKFG